MELTLRKGYLIKCCKMLIALMSHNNYYSRFYNSFCLGKIILLPLIRQFFLIPDEINLFVDLRQ
jgi:hypothetical protein